MKKTKKDTWIKRKLRENPALRETLRAFGRSGRHSLLLKFFSVKKGIYQLTKEQTEALNKLVRKIPPELEISPEWRSLEQAEIRFGDSLVPQISRLWKAHALALTRNLAFELTPLVHIRRAERCLNASAAWLDFNGFKDEYHFYFCRRKMLEYLRDVGIEEKRIICWDGIERCVFERVSAVNYLRSLKPGVKREGKRSGMKGRRYNERYQVGGWEIPHDLLEKLEIETAPFSPI